MPVTKISFCDSVLRTWAPENNLIHGPGFEASMLSADRPRGLSGAELRGSREAKKSFCNNDLCVAEREGFEPSIRFWRILTFQASAFDHSATAPHAFQRGAP